MRERHLTKYTTIENRKSEHLKICAEQAVEFQHKTTWFEHVELVHQAIPEVSSLDIDISTQFLGRPLKAPFMIGAMTGGIPDAKDINLILASLAQEFGIGLALGSQRPMIEKDSLVSSYLVRDVAPDVLLLGNIGIFQAINMRTEAVVNLMHRLNADAICLHLNTAMEIFQKEGYDRVYGAKATIKRLADALGNRLVVKEVGCGISRETALILHNLGVQTIDVSGAGGTSWVRIEHIRNRGVSYKLSQFEEWGIPTAASLLELNDIPVNLIASGGIRSAFDLAKALALGAEIGSATLPLLLAVANGGIEQARQWINSLISGLRIVMVLTGCYNLKDIHQTRTVILGPLREWITQ